MTVNGMESEKDTTGRNLGIVKMVDGVKYIAGRPIIEYGGILPGKYLWVTLTKPQIWLIIPL